jgi:YDG domain
VSDKTYDGTAAAIIATRSVSGVLANDVVSYAGGTATFSDSNAGMGKTVTVAGLYLAGSDAGNYTVNSTATATATMPRLASRSPGAHRLPTLRLVTAMLGLPQCGFA